MWCEGRILGIDGKPVANCTIETWETDDEGLYVLSSLLSSSSVLLLVKRTDRSFSQRLQVRHAIRGPHRR
jgi:protocatechuate 3,4-dioxygenase beta subunit